MEEDVLSALKSRAALIPGGSDRENRILIVINVFSDIQPWNKKCLELCISYIKKSLSVNVLNKGVTIILDAQKCSSSRLIRNQTRHVYSLFEDDLVNVLLVRPEGFWDKHVDHCTKAQGKREPIVITKSRLLKYFEISELPEDLGGTLEYNHDLWIQNRVHIEEFRMKYEKTCNDLENLHILLLDHKSMRPSEANQAIQSCAQLYADVQSAVKNVIETGNQLTTSITDSYRLQAQDSISNFSNINNSCLRIPQDLIGERDQIEGLLNDIEKKQSDIRIAWNDLEKSIHDARELALLEEGVSFVTNWILGTAELMLNRQQRVGYDVQSSEELRRENELLEMECWETYGFYAEMLYKIDSYPFNKESFAYKDLMSQKDFMDFVCRSFATRLERRRNILITSLRFFRLVSEYFDKTSEVFESFVMGNKVDDFQLASVNLQKLKDFQHTLDNVERELIKDGEKLSDMLSMPVKDALGRDIGIDYSDDIVNIRDILDATIARRNIFIDSVELQKLTLEQVTHIYAYEQDAEIAIKWMEDLYSVMIKCHSHVGCNVHEIQIQKDELQTFQETGKSIYNYGCQLLEASHALRLSCKLDIESNNLMMEKLRQIWMNLQMISQEHMTRLRVSAVFHRSVEEYCYKLHDLKTTVMNIGEIDELEKRRIRLRKYLTLRERLLVEVGRMVRLGRLLKSRLKEPFILEEKINNGTPSDNGTIIPTGGNSIACDAISNKLTEVADIAESLDSVLRDTQNGLDLTETNSSSSEKKCEPVHNGSIDEWSSSVRSTEDESFLTASDCACTPQSRSSSYQTTSECRASPWWSSNDKSSSEDCSNLSPETSSFHLLNGILSSTNASFDSSDHSFRSAQASPHLIGSTPGKIEKPPEIKTSENEKSKLCNGNAEINDKIDKNNEEQSQVRSSEIKQNGSWSNNYYQNVVPKHVIKGCL